MINLLLYFLIPLSFANPTIKVAVLDSGLDLGDKRFTHICPSGSEDFTGEGLEDKNWHGTHIVGLIQQYAKDSNYCLIILKYYSDNSSAKDNVINYLKALKKAIALNVDVINFSGGGPEKLLEEEALISRSGVKFFTAAGNDSVDLDKSNYYPASYDLKNVITVGALDKFGKPAQFSNFGEKVKVWEYGEHIESTVPGGVANMSGTSQATAIFTGKWLYENR